MRHGCAEPVLTNIDRHLQLSIVKRGWTPIEIRQAYDMGAAIPAVGMTANSTAATRFVHPVTGKSVIINNTSGRVIHVGGEDFQY